MATFAGSFLIFSTSIDEEDKFFRLYKFMQTTCFEHSALNCSSSEDDSLSAPLCDSLDQSSRDNLYPMNIDSIHLQSEKQEQRSTVHFDLNDKKLKSKSNIHWDDFASLVMNMRHNNITSEMLKSTRSKSSAVSRKHPTSHRHRVAQCKKLQAGDVARLLNHCKDMAIFSVDHIPFACLQELQIQRNDLLKGVEIIALAVWPNLKVVDIQKNPITNLKKKNLSLVKNFLWKSNIVLITENEQRNNLNRPMGSPEYNSFGSMISKIDTNENKKSVRFWTAKVEACEKEVRGMSLEETLIPILSNLKTYLPSAQNFEVSPEECSVTDSPKYEDYPESTVSNAASDTYELKYNSPVSESDNKTRTRPSQGYYSNESFRNVSAITKVTSSSQNTSKSEKKHKKDVTKNLRAPKSPPSKSLPEQQNVTTPAVTSEAKNLNLTNKDRFYTVTNRTILLNKPIVEVEKRNITTREHPTTSHDKGREPCQEYNVFGAPANVAFMDGKKTGAIKKQTTADLFKKRSITTITSDDDALIGYPPWNNLTLKQELRNERERRKRRKEMAREKIERQKEAKIKIECDKELQGMVERLRKQHPLIEFDFEKKKDFDKK